jgi:hypothetical protein
VHVIDEPGGEDVANHRGAAAEADVSPVRSLACASERIGRRRVDEEERRAPSISIDGRG